MQTQHFLLLANNAAGVLIEHYHLILPHTACGSSEELYTTGFLCFVVLKLRLQIQWKKYFTLK